MTRRQTVPARLTSIQLQSSFRSELTGMGSAAQVMTQGRDQFDQRLHVTAKRSLVRNPGFGMGKRLEDAPAMAQWFARQRPCRPGTGELRLHDGASRPTSGQTGRGRFPGADRRTSWSLRKALRDARHCDECGSEQAARSRSHEVCKRVVSTRAIPQKSCPANAPCGTSSTA